MTVCVSTEACDQCHLTPLNSTERRHPSCFLLSPNQDWLRRWLGSTCVIAVQVAAIRPDLMTAVRLVSALSALCRTSWCYDGIGGCLELTWNEWLQWNWIWNRAQCNIWRLWEETATWSGYILCCSVVHFFPPPEFASKLWWPVHINHNNSSTLFFGSLFKDISWYHTVNHTVKKAEFSNPKKIYTCLYVYI